MTQPVLKIILNWANEGDTPDTVDLTANTVQTQISRGRNIIQDLYEVGSASFKVVDPDGDWNPQNTASPYYGKVFPLRKVSMYATWLGIDYPIFTGFTMTYDYTYPKDQAFGYITIKCEDAFRLFNMAAVSTVTGGVAGQTTGQRINSILDQIGWSATDRDIDAGLTVCLADPGTVRPALQALRTVEFSEGLGAFYMSADGKATFRNRQNTIIGFAPRTTRTNFILNPSFETNLSYGTETWQNFGGGVTLTRITTDGFVGLSCCQVSKPATANRGVQTNSTTVNRIPVTAGIPYRFSAYVKVPTGQPNCNLRIRTQEYRADSTRNPDQVSATTIVTDAQGWVRLSFSDTPVAGATPTVSMVFGIEDTQAVAKTFLVDAFMVEETATLNDYFDGDYSPYAAKFAANTAWSGTANNSVSTVSFLTYPDPTTFDQSTGIGYQNITYALDDKLLVNEATFTRVGGSAQTHTDATSVAKYFVHSISKPDLLMDTDALALDLAKAYVAGRQDTEIRIENLTLMLNGVTDSNHMISIIDIDYFDKVLISNDQPGGSTITETLFVQGLTHNITPNRWITTIKTYESLLDGLVLNDSVKGTLDYNVLGY